ncbi:hypothetical protein Y032_0666g1332 [Ancylostoma ceylanicum]|uniref:G-protein coupled receptors family 1 profile domain-containing protein n=1 Tax=Ancylostoma ceylanicum TaxID=53326 RepID=A0A016WHE1_9BILA|nr:hypothetical protein Y032_0666g1332 [Ancylostoma ceylanicum]
MRTYSDLEFMTESECYEIITKFVTYPPFRAIQILQLLLSFVSMFFLVYVELKYVLTFSFHRNTKIILSALYLMGITDAIVNVVMQVTQLALTTSGDPCESFPSKVFYTVIHLILTTLTVGMVMMLFVVMCERGVATFCSQKYETTGVMVGISLTALGVS